MAEIAFYPRNTKHTNKTKLHQTKQALSLCSDRYHECSAIWNFFEKPLTIAWNTFETFGNTL